MVSRRHIVCKIVWLGILVHTSYSSFAQSGTEESLSFQLQVRPRAELRNGVFTPILDGQKAASFISQRNRIGLNYSRLEKLTTQFSIQMNNVWGNDPQIQVSANNISLFEAWAQLSLAPAAQIKIGRQILSYDDERILGALDWNNAGRKHDAALLMFAKGRFQTHVALALNQNSEKVTGTFFNDSLSQPYKNLQFVWLKFKVNDSLSFSSLLMNQTRQRTSDSLLSSLQTFGINTYYKSGKINITASFYYQTGKSNIINAASI